ncbi:MAG: mechanosensitive ion channel [Blastocatellia bacterium]
MEQVQTIFTNIIQIIGGYVPKAVGALLLLIAAWIVATILRAVVRRLCRAAKLDERTSSPVSGNLSEMAYWLAFLFFLPGILEALGLQQLLVPVQAMLNKTLGFVPNLMGASLIFIVGLFVARIVRQIVSNLLTASGANNLSERIGLAKILGEQKLSGIIGLVVFTLIMIPVVQASLSALALETVTRPVEAMLSRIVLALPSILSAGAVLIISYYLGRVLGDFVSNLLYNIGFNALLMRLGLRQSTTEGAKTPSEMMGSLVTVGIMLFALIESAQLMGFATLSGLISQFTVFAGQLVTGIVIFGVGLYLANLAVAAVRSSGIANADTVATVARIAIVVLAGAMALRQMGLASEIINMAFGLLVGAIAIATAIAFGLGGRESAASMVEEWRQSWKGKSMSTTSTGS